MDIWAAIWQNGTDQDPNGKVHKAVVRAILGNLDLSTKFSTIYTMVELQGVSDDLDKLATARAIRDERDMRRILRNLRRPAICA